MKSLYLNNFDTQVEPQVPFYQNSKTGKSSIPFVMKTCQRTLVISTQPLKIESASTSLTSTEAYRYILEMLCGLKSRLIAEHEIVSQYKTFLSQYLSYINRDPELIPYLQKLLQDCKSIRSNHLIGISQKTYAALSRKILRTHDYDNETNILIYGSGQLAEDLINQFKKSSNVFVTGRNQEKVSKLTKQHDVSAFEWKNFNGYLDFRFQLNTIGTEENIFDSEFSLSWNKHHGKKGVIIDLGEPSPYENAQTITEAQYYGLDQIFEKGAIENAEKKKKIVQAGEAIKELSLRRYQWFETQFQKKQEYINDNLHNRKPGKSVSSGTSLLY